MCLHRVALLLLPLLTGCAGFYVELSGAVSPSAKYTVNGAPRDELSGTATTIGFAAGFDFDSKREGRFAMGYGYGSTSYGGTSGRAGMIGARLDYPVMRLTPRSNVRIGGGISGGSIGTKAVKPTGETIDGSTKAWEVYGGLVFTQYISRKHNVVHVMVGGQYQSIDGPVSEVKGAGIVGKITYTFTFGDTRQGSNFDAAFDEGAPELARGARAIGCEAQAVRSDTSASVGVFATCDSEEINFFKSADSVRRWSVSCHKLDRDECEELATEILGAARAKASHEKKSSPASGSTPAAPGAQPNPFSN